MLFIAFILSLLAGIYTPAAAPAVSDPVEAAVIDNKTENSASADKLVWTSGKKLSWEDFKGTPEEGDPHHALTTANLALDAKCKGNKFEYEVTCVFLANESWTKNTKSEQLLHHEQLHFDLTEVHARLLRKKLQEIGTNCEIVQLKLDASVKAAFAAWKAEQDKFDKLSSHGLNKTVQEEWAANIEQRLQELEAYQ